MVRAAFYLCTYIIRENLKEHCRDIRICGRVILADIVKKLPHFFLLLSVILLQSENVTGKAKLKCAIMTYKIVTIKIIMLVNNIHTQNKPIL